MMKNDQSQYHETRQLKNGVFEEYFKNDSLLSKGAYIDGERDGEWKTYHDDGTLEKMKVYKRKAL